jgi:hypothetical protein
MAETPPPEATQLPAPDPQAAQPKATWVGELRVITREIEGPDGEKVTTEVERVPHEFVMGVPARNLTKQEYDALAPDKKKLVDTCGLYRVTKEAGEE